MKEEKVKEEISKNKKKDKKEKKNSSKARIARGVDSPTPW